MLRVFVSKKLYLIVLLCTTLVGCAGAPKGFLKPTEGYLEKRQLQMRQYDTKDEEKIIVAVAGVLQDLSFTLDDSETKLGLVVASKKADARNTGQIAGAMLLDVMSAFGGTYSNVSSTVDFVQHIKASVIAKPSLEGNRIVVRVTFQRVIWNARNQINRVESINDPEVYQKFYENLSKAIFLEAHSV